MSHPPIDELNLLHTNVCRALADPKRLLILYELNEQPLHVTALAEVLDLPQPTISRHLRVLRQHSLVTTERVGPTVIYYLADQRIISVLDMMRQVMYDAVSRQSSLILGSAPA